MELYFKDLEADCGENETGLDCPGVEHANAQAETAEDIAFAELAERVSAARLVY